MKTFVSALGATVLTVLLGSAPALAVSSSSNQAQSVTFDTAFAPQYFGAGEYDGVMHLTFGPHGIVSGWYRSVDVGIPRPVVGGLDGDKLWLDLGSAGLHQVETTYDRGKIVGATYLGDQPYSFTATPSTTPQI